MLTPEEFEDVKQQLRDKIIPPREELTIKLSGPPTTHKGKPTRAIALFLQRELGYATTYNEETEPRTNEIFACKHSPAFPDGHG